MLYNKSIPKFYFNALQKCLLRSDYLNRGILLRRALYTAHLASQLGSWAQVDGVKFSLLEGDPLKPVVQLTPVGKLGKYTTIRIIAVPPEDFFKLSQLHPNKSNVKRKFVLGTKDIDNVSGNLNTRIISVVVC